MSTEESEAHTNSNEIQETGKTEIPVNNIDKTVDNEIEIAPRHKKVSDNAHDINNNKLVDDSHNSSHINNNDAETDEKDLNRNIESSASSNQSHSNMEQQHSEQEVQANKKTENNSSFSKRPFNVVMTPSDKSV